MSVTKKFPVFLVFTSRGLDRATKSRPTHLRGGEYAVKITLEVPASLFADSVAEATLTIPESAVIHPTVAVVENLAAKAEGAE